MQAEESYSTSVSAAKAGASVHQLRIYVRFGLVAPCKMTNGGHAQYGQTCVARDFRDAERALTVHDRSC